MTKREIRKAIRNTEAMRLCCGAQIAVTSRNGGEFVYVGVADERAIAAVTDDVDAVSVATAMKDYTGIRLHAKATLGLLLHRETLPELAMIIQVLIEESRKRKGN